MTFLQYYSKERKAYPNEFGRCLNIREANIIIKKLIRHYKLDSYNSWKFVGTTSSRCVTYKQPKSIYFVRKPYGYFKFSKSHTSVGVICHELAHAIEMIKKGKSTHAGSHFKIMKKLINYCRKAGYVKFSNKDDVVFIVSGKERQGMSSMALQIQEYLK